MSADDPEYARLLGAALLAHRDGADDQAAGLMEAAGLLRTREGKPGAVERSRAAVASSGAYLRAAGRKWPWSAKDGGRGKGKGADRTLGGRIRGEVGRLATTLLHLPGDSEVKKLLGESMERIIGLVQDNRASARCVKEAGRWDVNAAEKSDWTNRCKTYALTLSAELLTLGDAANKLRAGEGETAHSLSQETASIAAGKDVRKMGREALDETLRDVAELGRKAGKAAKEAATPWLPIVALTLGLWALNQRS